MRDEKGHIRQTLKKMRPGDFLILGIILTVMLAVVISARKEHIKKKIEIDPQKEVFLFLHGRADLREQAETTLITYGFPKEKIIKASSENIGKVGDYMAMLWRPPKPDHIKIQKITKVKAVEPEEMFGLWKGVSKRDIDTVPLK